MIGSTIAIGLVGGGGITDTHARAALAIPGARVAAIAGPNAVRVKEYCGQYGGAPCAGVDDLLARRPMDLVVVGSPSGLHADQAIEVVKQGIPVLVEKPIDIDLERVDALIAEADRAGVAVGVIFQDRFKPDLLKVKDLLARGALGAPLLVRAEVPWYRPPSYYADSRWRGTPALDGGALMNQGIHTLDLLLWLLGDVARVRARTATVLHRVEVEDTAFALLDFASGVTGSYMATTAAFPGTSRRVTISGSRGSLTIEGDDLVAADGLEGPLAPASARAPSPAASSPIVADISAHLAVLEDFIDSVRTGRRPCCDARDGRRSVALIAAIHEAAKREG